MDRLSDFKRGTGDEIKADEDWRGVGLPQDAMHSQFPHFLDLFRQKFLHRHAASKLLFPTLQDICAYVCVCSMHYLFYCKQVRL